MIDSIIKWLKEKYMSTDKLFDIEEELDKLPNSPGVYIMHSSTGAIL